MATASSPVENSDANKVQFVEESGSQPSPFQTPSKEHGFDYFTTTLTISPLKNAQLLNSIGAELAEKYGIPWLYSDFKKREGYKRSIILSKEYDLYRQNHCGCVFSKRDSMQSKN